MILLDNFFLPDKLCLSLVWNMISTWYMPNTSEFFMFTIYYAYGVVNLTYISILDFCCSI